MFEVLAPAVHTVPGMPLYAMCRDREYNGVVWTGFGRTHHLYEDLQLWGTWISEDLTAWKEGDVDVWTYDVLEDTSVHKESFLVDMEWALPWLGAALVVAIALVVANGPLRHAYQRRKEKHA